MLSHAGKGGEIIKIVFLSRYQSTLRKMYVLLSAASGDVRFGANKKALVDY